jgi:amino acid adenylation domain-containing protein
MTGPASGRPAPLPGRSLHELFALQARRTPAAVAVEDERRALTFGELDGLANRVAHRLLGLGVRRQQRVGVLLPRSVEHVAAVLGILRCRAAYVPLDPGWPRGRTAAALETAAPAAVLSEAELADLDGPPGPDPGLGGHPDDVAYVFFTSGSTGRPKAVEVQHRGVLNEAGWSQRELGIRPEHRGSWLASPAFAVSRWELWPHLTAGARLCIAGDGTVPFPERLQGWLLSRRVTFAFAVPVLAEALWELHWPGTAALEVLATGGEKVPRWPPPDLPFDVMIAYGVTETAGVRLAYRTRGHPHDLPAPPIGLPIVNTRAWVADADLRPAPDLEAGELVIGGTGLATGYRGQPALTAERFVPDPFAAEPGARAYRTGDLVRRLADGCLDFLGRLDDQVKVGGVRLEPAEVEGLLLAHPDVARAVVVLRDDPPAGPVLAAYVVLRPGRPWDPAGLRAALAAHLPPALMPLLVPLGRLPLTAAGKIDRRALPRPEPPAPAAAADTPLARLVAGEMSDVVGRPVGAHDHFLLLGGTSLLAIRLATRLGEVVGREVAVRAIFDHATPAELAAWLEDSAGLPAAAGGEEAAGAPDLERALAGLSPAELDAMLEADDGGDRP